MNIVGWWQQHRTFLQYVFFLDKKKDVLRCWSPLFEHDWSQVCIIYQRSNLTWPFTVSRVIGAANSKLVFRIDHGETWSCFRKHDDSNSLNLLMNCHFHAQRFVRNGARSCCWRGIPLEDFCSFMAHTMTQNMFLTLFVECLSEEGFFFSYSRVGGILTSHRSFLFSSVEVGRMVLYYVRSRPFYLSYSFRAMKDLLMIFIFSARFFSGQYLMSCFVFWRWTKLGSFGKN